MTGGGASRTAGRSSASWPAKKLLMGLIAVGSLGSMSIAGAYALSSESVNRRSTLATGTLTLSDTVGAGSTCYSYAGTNNSNGSCQALASSSTLMYPGESAAAKVKIENDGSLDGGSLVVFMPSCKAENTPSAPHPGAGNPCAGAGDQLYVQETNSSWEAAQCWYPVHQAGSCAWAKNSLYVFALNHATAESAVNLGSGPAHGQTRYFEIALRIPPEASSELQGRQAVFGLTWRLQT